MKYVISALFIVMAVGLFFVAGRTPWGVDAATLLYFGAGFMVSSSHIARGNR